MDRLRERLNRIREMANRAEEAAGSGRWDSALARAVTLHNDAAFIVDWLRGQAEYHFNEAPPAGADAWEPTAEPPQRQRTAQWNVGRRFDGSLAHCGARSRRKAG